MSGEKYVKDEPPVVPVRSLDAGVVLRHVIAANTKRDTQPPAYSPESERYVQVTPITTHSASYQRPESKRLKISWRWKVVCAIFFVTVTAAILLTCGLTLFFIFKGQEEPLIDGDIQEPQFYTNVSGIHSKIALHFKFPSDFLAELDQQKVAIIFLRQQYRYESGLFQVALLPFGKDLVNLKSLVKHSTQSLVKTSTNVNFYFDKYPIHLYTEIVIGAFDGNYFTWAACVHAMLYFNSKADGEKPMYLEVGTPRKAVSHLVKKVINQIGWTGISYSNTKSKAKLVLKVIPSCNDNFYLNDCSRFCAPRNSSAGHYTCTSYGKKRCLKGWLNPKNNCLNPDYCAYTKCENGGTCRNGNNTAVCTCLSGFAGNRCEYDINECLTGTRCFNGGTCQNTIGSFTCACPPTVQGKDCSTDVNECLFNGLCQNGGTCKNTYASYSCACVQNYKGKHCETKSLASTTQSSMAVLLFGMLCIIILL